MASYDIVAKVRADMSQFIAGMKSGEIASSNFAMKMGGMGNAVAVGTAAAVAVAGVALFKLGESYEKSYKQIRVSTGATGEELKALEANMRNVFAKTPASMGDVSTTISDLSVKLGLSGGPLESLSLQMIQLSRVTGTDLKGNIEGVTTVFKNFSVSASDQKDKLDLLYRASQNAGVPVAQLAGQMASSGVVLRQLGFDFDSSAALIGTFAKAGIDAGDVMPGLTFALKTAGKAGENTAELFTKTFDAIKAAPSVTEATGIAIETFGGRAGPKLAAAIQEGKLSYEEFLSTIQTGTDTIAKTSGDVGTFGGKLSVLGHQLMNALEPLATAIFQGMNSAMKAIMPALTSVIGYVGKLVDGFLAIPVPLQLVLPLLAATVLAFKAFGAIQGVMAIVKTSVVTGFQAMAASIGGYVAEMAVVFNVGETEALAFGYTVQAALGPIALAIGAVVIAWTIFSASSNGAAEATKKFTETLDEQTGAWTRNTDAYVQNEVFTQANIDKMTAAGISLGAWRSAIESGSKSLFDNGRVMREATLTTDAFTEGTKLSAEMQGILMSGLSTSTSVRDQFIAQLALAGAATRDLVTEFQTEAEAYDKKQADLKAVAIVTNESAGMTHKAAEAAAEAAAANSRQADSIQKVMDAQHAATDPVFAAIKAQMDARKAQQDYNEAIAAGKSGGDEGLRLTLAQAEAATAYRDAITNLDIAQLKGDSTNEKVMSALVQLRQFGFEPTAAQVAMLTEAIGTNQLKLIAMKDPIQATKDAISEMTQQGVEPSKTAIDAYVETLRGLEAKLAPDDPMRKNIDDTIGRLTDFGNLHPDVQANVTVNDAEWVAWLAEHKILMAEAYGPSSRVRATGGLVTAGTSYMVGERGPEMFVPQVPGSIVSADRVASMSAAGGAPGATYVTNVTANVHLPAGANGQDVIDAITKFERHNGKVFLRA